MSEPTPPGVTKAPGGQVDCLIQALGSDRFRAAIGARLARPVGPLRTGRPRKVSTSAESAPCRLFLEMCALALALRTACRTSSSPALLLAGGMPRTAGRAARTQLP